MSHVAPRLSSTGPERKLAPLSRPANLSVASRPTLVTVPSRDAALHYSARPLIVSQRKKRVIIPVIIQSSPAEMVETVTSFMLLKQQLIEEGLLYQQEQQHELEEFMAEVAREEADAQREAKRLANRKPLALLIAAHNEELVIENTIKSAIASGQPAEHIYVIDDNSDDTTSELARKLLPKKNVKKVDRSGKGLALMRGTKHFKLTKRYEWVHIADADGAFSADYFTHLKSELDPSYAAATGYIQSLPGGIISQCRVYEYTIGMEMVRRFQNLFGVIPIIPGATSCFRSDVFERVDFNRGSMTEDFDVTVQIHREKMGKIQFIEDAVAYTQDPKDLKDYIKQVERWNRGFVQVMRRHGLGRRLHRVDAIINYQLLVSFFCLANLLIWVPYQLWIMHSIALLGVMFVTDVITSFMMVVMVAAFVRRYDILEVFPFIYGLRWLNMFLFAKSMFEMVVLRKYRTSDGLWGTEGRRYKPVASN